MTTETILTPAQVDSLLEGVLRASGSRLGNYTYQKTLDDLRSSIRAIEQAVLQSNAEAIRAQLAEMDALREALEIARDFVAEALAQERDAYRGHESVSSIADIERYLRQIDAALAQNQGD